MASRKSEDPSIQLANIPVEDPETDETILRLRSIRKRKKEKADLEAARKAIGERNVAAREQYGRETELRGGLIASQRGGLASTILNLGGAGGDPSRPFASQLVGTTAAGAAPIPEAYPDSTEPAIREDSNVPSTRATSTEPATSAASLAGVSGGGLSYGPFKRKIRR